MNQYKTISEMLDELEMIHNRMTQVGSEIEDNYIPEKDENDIEE